MLDFSGHKQRQNLSNQLTFGFLCHPVLCLFCYSFQNVKFFSSLQDHQDLIYYCHVEILMNFSSEIKDTPSEHQNV